MRRVILFLAFTTAGCSLAPTYDEWRQAPFEVKPDSEEVTNDWIHGTFIDPFSTQIYSIEEAKKTCWHPGLISSKYYGWSWFVDLNSKNRVGGYAGRRVILLFYRGGGVAHTRDGGHFYASAEPPYGVQYYFREEHIR